MDAAELALILEGIDLAATKRRVQWNPKRNKNDNRKVVS